MFLDVDGLCAQSLDTRFGLGWRYYIRSNSLHTRIILWKNITRCLLDSYCLLYKCRRHARNMCIWNKISQYYPARKCNDRNCTDALHITIDFRKYRARFESLIMKIGCSWSCFSYCYSSFPVSFLSEINSTVALKEVTNTGKGHLPEHLSIVSSRSNWPKWALYLNFLSRVCSSRYVVLKSVNSTSNGAIIDWVATNYPIFPPDPLISYS